MDPLSTSPQEFGRPDEAPRKDRRDEHNANRRGNERDEGRDARRDELPGEQRDVQPVPADTSDSTPAADDGGELVRRDLGTATVRRPIPPKRYRIGEVVDYSGVSRQTIHNYTTMGLLRESCWSPGGHRLYDESVFERLDRIAALKAQRKSLRDIREHFARCYGP